MSAPCQSACSAWATAEDVQACGPCADAPDNDLELVLAVATDLLYELSGHRWPGICRDVVRPCAQRSDGTDPWTLRLSGAVWLGSCGCALGPKCGCSRLPELLLGARPVVRIVQVVLADDSNPSYDGTPASATLDPSAYRIDDFERLVRIDGEGWPCCQALELSAGEPNTFEVTFDYGKPPPPAATLAAASLACQLHRACKGEDCSLTPDVTEVARQGVTFVFNDRARLFENGLTGDAAADLFLLAYNPNKRRDKASIAHPEDRRRVRRAGT